MVTVLYQSYHDILGGEPLGQRQARLPWNRRVGHPVQEPHLAIERNCGPHDEVLLAVLEQARSIGVSGTVVFGGQRHRAGFLQLLPLCWVEPRPEKILGEIGRRRDADKPPYARGSGERGEQHDPSTHARPHRICRPCVSESSTAIASSTQRPIVPIDASPLDAPWPKWSKRTK